MRDPKLGDNTFPDKPLGIHVSDICKWFGLDPFGEAISADEKIPLVLHCFRKWL